MPPTPLDRRAFLRSAGTFALGALAGCGDGSSGVEGSSTTSVSGAPPGSARPPGEGAPDGGALDAGLSPGGETPDHRDAGAAAPGDEFPPWAHGTTSESAATVLMFRGDARRNFGGTGPLSSKPTLRWKYRMGALSIAKGDGPKTFWTGTGWTGQAVKWGKRVFVGGLDGRFYCWNAETGAVIWSLKTERMFKSSPCFYKGNLYVGNVDNHVRCIDGETGDVMWKRDVKHDCDSSPVVVENTVYVGGEGGVLQAFDADTGHSRWALKLGGQKGPGGSQGIESSPAVLGNDLYVTSYDGVLYRVDRAEGTVLSRMTTGDDTDASPVIAGDRLFVAVEEKNPTVQAWDRKTEKQLWSFRSDKGFWSTPAVVNGRVYIGGDDAKLHCLDAATGKPLWAFEAQRGIWSSPCVVDGKVVFGSYDGFLYMLDAASGKELWRHDLEGPVLSTACIVDGAIYIGSGDGHFYCFGA